MKALDHYQRAAELLESAEESLRMAMRKDGDSVKVPDLRVLSAVSTMACLAQAHAVLARTGGEVVKASTAMTEDWTHAADWHRVVILGEPVQ